MGLSGSLVLGFLELQASHAHNRFYNELEEWLSGITELTPAGGVSLSDYVNRQLSDRHPRHAARARRTSPIGSAMQPAGGAIGAPPQEDVRDLARGVNQLVTQMRAEQKVVREWVDEQAAAAVGGRQRAARDLADQHATRGV